MRHYPDHVCLIVPCFNEEKRLNLPGFTSHPSFTFLFVNDGSRDKTAEMLERQASETVHVLHLRQNVGKAEAVRRGMLYLLDQSFARECEWFGYWDADLSTPLAEVERFIRFHQVLEPTADAVWGSRIYRLGGQIRRSYLRHLLGRTFATVSGAVFPELKAYDSQCGAKLFRRRVILEAFAEPFISRWIFDIEIALRLLDRRIVEYPLSSWTAAAGSKLRLLTHAPRIVADIARVRRYYPRRVPAYRYDAVPP